MVLRSSISPISSLQCPEQHASFEQATTNSRASSALVFYNHFLDCVLFSSERAGVTDVELESDTASSAMMASFLLFHS
jgi:hypothetical protein